MLVATALAGGGCGGGGHLSGAGGAGQIMTGSGGAIGGTGAGGATGINCGANNARQLLPLPPDILIVLDTSASMNDGFDGPCAGGCGALSQWAAAVSTIDSLAGATRPVATWGLKLIADGGNGCDAGGIAVPIGATSGQIPAALAYRTTAAQLGTPGNRPLRAAIEIAAAHLSGRNSGPPHIILLVTDGVPDCKPGETDPLASDAAGAVQAINDASAAGLATYVIGVGALDAAADGALAQLAMAGGLARTGTPAYAPAVARSDLMTAVNSFVTKTAACTYAIPEAPDAMFDRGHISVQLMGGDGFYQDIQHDPVNGWDYTDASLSGLQLHGQACDSYGGSFALQVAFKCYDD